MKVCIVGLGYVGLTFAGRCLQVGHEVYGVEINEYVKNKVSLGEAHFHEPGLNDILKRGLTQKKLELINPENSREEIDVIMITVGTPLIKGSNTPNLGYINDAIRSVAHLITNKNLIVLRSTVTVGLTRKSVIPMISSLTNLKPSELNIGFCPERTLEGDALNELATLPQIVSGNSLNATELAKSFFQTVSNSVICAESLEAAELVKLFNNVYRDVNFSIGNLFNDIAMSFGINGIDAISLANQDYSRSKIAKPGLVGGPCLEKDSYILCSNLDNIELTSVVLEARKYNESLETKIVMWCLENSPSRIILCGMAFKGIPSTNDLRGSSSVNIARKLHSYGKKVVMFDPICSTGELAELGFGDICDDINTLNLHSDDCVIVLNNNEYFESNQFANLVSNTKLLDIWDVTNLTKKITLGNYRI
jgi:nucleotide sugar dehydrogenase